MLITRVTTFPSSLTLPGGNQISVTGNNGTELKNAEIAALDAKIASSQAGATAAQSAKDALNT